MEITKSGFWLGISSILAFLIFIAIGCLIKVFLKNKKARIAFNIFKIFLGISALAYFIVFRYAQDVINLITALKNYNGNDISILWSKVLLLDMCPFMYVVLCLNLIAGWRNKFSFVVGVWCVICSSITLIGGIWKSDVGNNLLIYLFVRSSEGPLYFFIHIFMLTIGSILYVDSMKLRWNQLVDSHLLGIIYILYVLTIVKTLDITRNATGLVPFDWLNPSGEYNSVFLIFKIGFPGILFLSYFLVWLFLVIMITLKLLISKPIEPLYFFPKWVYHKFPRIREISENRYANKMWKKEKKQLYK